MKRCDSCGHLTRSKKTRCPRCGERLGEDSRPASCSRRLEFLIRHAYTQKGTDGVMYWCCAIFPVGDYDTFEAALDAEILSENAKDMTRHE